MNEQIAVITAIEPGRRRGRFNIYVNGEFVASAGEKSIGELIESLLRIYYLNENADE